jgi:urease accessory protein
VCSMWIGELSLDFERSGDRTVIARRRHQGPLLVQRPFYEPDGTCQVYLLHPPGGVVGGDRLSCFFDVRGDSHALVTTPGATKLYRSARQRAEILHDVRSSGGGSFEWLPQETIVFGGVQAQSSLRVRLDASSHFIGWDIVCLGQDNRGLSSGHLVQRYELERDGRRLWCERAEFEGGAAVLTAPWGLAGRSVVGTLIATGANASDVLAVREGCAGSLAETLPDEQRDWLSVTRLGEVLLCRYLGYSAEAAKRCLCAVWAILRKRLLGRDARQPRVWAT